LQPIAAERLAKLAPAGRSPAWTSGRTNLSSPEAWNLGRGWSVASGAAAFVTEFVVEAALVSDAVAAAAAGIVAMKERRCIGPPGAFLDERDFEFCGRYLNRVDMAKRG
jgi:hypothetical protein